MPLGTLRGARLLFVALLACWFAAQAQAQLARDLYVEITNLTGVPITHVYVSPHDANSWEDNLLGGKRVLGAGDRLRVNLRGFNSPIFDIRLVDQGGATYTFWQVDVSRRSIVARMGHQDWR